MQNELLKSWIAEDLQATKIGDKVFRALRIFQEIQEDAAALCNTSDSKLLLSLKSGTILAYAMIKKIVEGKNPRTFSPADWEDIYYSVSEYAIKMEPQKYTEFVFLLYADYIDFSISVIGKNVSEENVQAVKGISDEIRIKTELLKTNKIPETDYIESCLWLSLEAMIKLVSVYWASLAGAEFEKLSTAVSTFAFEYGRLCLYRKEQALLEQYMQNQQILDAQLAIQFEDFKKELNAEEERFNNLIHHAFDQDFRNNLRGSVELALAAGVPKKEILDSEQKVDEFFLD